MSTQLVRAWMPFSIPKKLFKKIIARSLSLLMIINGCISIVSAILIFVDKPLAQQLFVYYKRLAHIQSFEIINTVLVLFLGIFLCVLGVGLYKRHRRAWSISNFVLILLMLASIFPVIKPAAFIVYSISWLLLLFAKSYFNKKNYQSTTAKTIALCLVVFAFIYGIVGSYLLKDQFHGITNISDSIYYTVVTYSTVGYGDITPVTPGARLFVVSMILIGLSAFATALTVFVLPFMEREIKRVFKIMNNFTNAKNHIIIVGFNNISMALANNMSENNRVIFSETNPQAATQIEQKGYTVVLGEVSEESVRKQLNLHHAKCVICLDENDANNILNTMSIAMQKFSHNKLLPKIITRINNPQNIEKANQAGANEVFSPTLLCEQHLEKIIFEPA